MANIGVKIELEGAPQYKENMANLTAQTKLYEAQVKSLQSRMSSGMSAFQKSITTSKALEQQLQSLRNKSTLLEEQIAKNSEKYGEDSTNVIRLKTQYQKLQQQIADTEQSLKDLGGAWGAAGAQMKAVGDKLDSIGSKMQSVGSTLTQKVSLPIAGLGTAAVKTFADWESAFTGVMKTVEETGTTTYEDLAEGIKKMSTETASSKEEIAGVAAAAGQLGVGADDIMKFTETMVKLGDSTNLTAEEAATAIAKISNITGEPLENVDKLGASIVALGNNFATNEAAIVEMSNRLASAGTIAGLSTTEILALSTAMSSVGIEAEAGGTAMTQTLTNISQAVSDGDTKLEQLAQVAGKSAQEFASEWEASPVTALQDFIGGLSDMNAAGEDTYSVLDQLGMSGIRQSNMLQSLALASDQLTNAVNISSDAYRENTALTDEAQKRYQTFNSKLSQTKEMAKNVGIQFGEIMLPYIQKLLEKIQSLVNWFGNLDKETQEFIVKAAAIAAAIGPIILAIVKVISLISSISTAVGTVMTWIPAISGALSAVGAVITGTLMPAIGAIVAAIVPFLPIIAAVAAAIAAVVVVVKNWGAITDFVTEKWTALTEFVGNATNQIQQFFSNNFGIIGDIVAAKIEFIKITISTAVQIIQVIFTTFGELIKAITNGDWAAIGQIISGAWEQIKLIIANAIVMVVQNIAGLVLKVQQSFINMKNSIVNTIKNVVTSIKNMISNIKNTFNELISSAMEWGSHFVQNFCDGITAKMQALIDRVRSMADTVRSYLHFSTGPDVGPLKGFNAWPRHMMENYANGIDAARYLVKDAVTDVAADVSVLSDPFDYASMYNAVRSGASDAELSLSIGEREFTRALKEMGVAF